MPTFTKLLRAGALAAAVGTALTVAPVAYAAHGGGGGGGGGGGFHGGGFGGGGFHGGGFHSGAVGLHGGGLHGPVAFRGGFRGGRHDGYWRNGVWIGAWDAYCDPNSPYFDPDYCYAY